PCFYGIDMSTVKELFAPRFMHGSRPTEAEQDAMAAELDAQSLVYLPLEAVARCIGLPEDRLCRACITGQYPTPTGEKLYQLALLNRDAENHERTYEMGNGNGHRTNGSSKNGSAANGSAPTKIVEMGR